MAEELLGPAPVGWRYSDLGELQVPKGIQGGPFGSQLHSADYSQTGIPLIMPKNIGENRLRETGHDLITKEDAERLEVHRVRIGDIVVGRKGDLSRRALIREAEEGWLCGTDCIRIRTDQGRASSVYLSYYLGIRNVSSWLHRYDTGSTMPNLNTTSLSRLPILLPSSRYQIKVASILSSLDDKIVLNERIARTARELGRANFSALAQSDHAEDVELSAIVEFLSRGVAPRYTEDDKQLRVLNQKCVRDGRVNIASSRRMVSDKVPAVKLLQTNDVLVNSTGVGTLGRVARWTSTESCTVDSHVTIVRFDTAKVDPVCAGFAMLDTEPEITNMGEGSTGQTELSRAKLSTLRITLPSKDQAVQLRPVLDALESRGDRALEESRSLAELRDALLPRLMSGEIRVRDAEKIVEDVT